VFGMPSAYHLAKLDYSASIVGLDFHDGGGDGGGGGDDGSRQLSVSFSPCWKILALRLVTTRNECAYVNIERGLVYRPSC
jgi:hypothetical protein